MSSNKKKKKLAREMEFGEETMQDHIRDNLLKSNRLTIKDFKLTEKQKQFVKLAFDKNTKILFINGPAGTGKTLMSVYCCLHMLNANPEYTIKYIRTIAESGDRGLGSLPGTVDEKFDPFMSPLRDKLDELIPISQAKKLEQDGIIEAVPINYLRGASWKNMLITSDESQNFSVKEIITLLTRIGENTKMFICGDAMQSDIGARSGFMTLYSAFNDEESKARGIHCIEFTEEDIMRSEILKFIVNKINRMQRQSAQ